MKLRMATMLVFLLSAGTLESSPFINGGSNLTERPNMKRLAANGIQASIDTVLP